MHFFRFSIWGTFPCYLLHFGANISHTHCSPHLCVAFLFLILYPAAALCVAGVALGDIHLHFAWQARHLSHWAGCGGALGRRWSPVAPRHFAWQAWRLATSTCFDVFSRHLWPCASAGSNIFICFAARCLPITSWSWHP